MEDKHISTIRVLLIDDHPLFRKGVGQMISDDPGFEVVGEADSGEQGIAMAHQLLPDVILLDLHMKGMDGLETLRRLKASEIQASCVMLTVSDAEEDLLEALRAGADGYLLKDMEPEQLRESLLKATKGVTIIQDRLTDILTRAALFPESKNTPDTAILTERENQILDCIAAGMNNKTIARELGITDSTVKVHIKNLLRKLNLTSRLEAAVWKFQRNNSH
ncbi:two-component system response regulator NarL [Methylophaga pinxianii]|uniref:two-component system response regulator NarL n=1 Tax=Methylophaga pinxianii TaxID=2881052 RepID=UPI001CF4DAD9|nr:two-component system response regulator NarL [Methylophaga pinxianii]MCB2426665.1 two-component system response regulator NarL [Methylophaga pinxianii]UPH45075.1 two-component system response regulator NarL [Methylophaga pinxianii]